MDTARLLSLQDSQAQVVEIAIGPPERVHDGWGGTSQPLYRLNYPCGCSFGSNSGTICTAHLVYAAEQIAEQAMRRRQAGF